MLEIRLELAENGIVKNILDTNVNGAGGFYERRVVYDLSEDHLDDFVKTTELLESICSDFGINLGNKNSRSNLNFVTNWGSGYLPSEEELEEQIKDTEENLQKMQEYLARLKKS